MREVERMSKDLTKLKDELWIMQKDQKVYTEKQVEFGAPFLLFGN